MAMSIAAYDLLKAAHVSAVSTSLALFVVRAIWRVRDSPHLGDRWVRIVPHVVDTVLLGAGIGLALMLENYPGTHAWLTAKVAGLVAYIVLGSIALKRGRTPAVRAMALVGALAVFAYIVAVAIAKSPRGFFT
jgi:uncharacterized membrane protein SirB2